MMKIKMVEIKTMEKNENEKMTWLLTNKENVKINQGNEMNKR